MRIRSTIYILPLAFLAIFYFYPLAAILRLSFSGEAANGAGLAALFADSYYLRVVWFSTWQAALSTALTLLLGVPAAYAFARFAFPGKALLRALATAPFVLPTIVAAAAFGALLGRNGLLNAALQALFALDEPPIVLERTLALVLLAHVFYNYSVVIRIVGSVWGTLDPRLEQAAAVLGANRRRVLREITLPLLLPAIGAAALLTFIFTFSSFGIILILGGPQFATVEVEIYRQTTQNLRLDVAAALALTQLFITLAVSVLYTRLQARASVPLDQRAREANLRPARTRGERLFLAANLAMVLLLIGAPLLALTLRSLTSLSDGSLTLDYYRQLGVNRTGSIFYVPPLQAIGNSLAFALLATVLALLVAIPAAYLLTRATPNREQQTTGRRTPGAVLRSLFIALLDPIFMLPLGTSAVTLGLGYIVALGRPPLNLIRSPLLIPAAHALLAFPFVLRSLLPTLRALDLRLREAARTLGANPRKIFREIDLPLLFPALLVGAIFAFTVSLGEFGATLLIARPEYPTIPLAIYGLLGKPGASNYGQALALSTLLMLLSTAGFILLERMHVRELGEF